MDWARTAEGQDLNIWRPPKAVQQNYQFPERTTAESSCSNCISFSRSPARLLRVLGTDNPRCPCHRGLTVRGRGEITPPPTIRLNAEVLTLDTEGSPDNGVGPSLRRLPSVLGKPIQDDRDIHDDGYTQPRKGNSTWVAYPRYLDFPPRKQREFKSVVKSEWLYLPEGCETVEQIYYHAIYGRYSPLHWGSSRDEMRKLCKLLEGFVTLDTSQLGDSVEYGCQKGDMWGGTGTTRRSSSGSKKMAIAATLCCGITLVPLVAAQHHVPGAVLHSATGTSLTTSLVVPLLRNSGDLLPPAYLIATYASWGAAFAAHLVCELLRRPNSLQRRLLGGTVLFSALNLLGTLSQSASSTLEGILSWGPLALTVSLCVIPVVMELINPREAAVVVANLVGVHIPAHDGR